MINHMRDIIDKQKKKILKDFINTDKFRDEFIPKNYEMEYIEILEYFVNEPLYLISALVHTKSKKELLEINYANFIIYMDDNKLQIYDGKLYLNSRLQSIVEYSATITYINGRLIVDYYGKMRYKKANDALIFRLNVGLEITEFKVDTYDSKLRKSDMLKNSYEVLLFKEKGESVDINFNCKYEGIPYLRFDNSISDIRTCIWGEAFIFPYISYLPLTKSMYKVYVKHPINTVLIGGKMLYEKDDIVTSILTNYNPSPLPIIQWGIYVIKKVNINEVWCNIYYSNDIGCQLIEIENSVVDILIFYENLYGEIPYKDICIVFDKGIHISCTQGHVILMRNNNIFELAHELAHLWWGSCITFYGYGANWIQEGLANISSKLYKKESIETIIAATIWNKNISIDEIMNNNLFGKKDSIYYQGMLFLCRIIKKITYNRFLEKSQKLIQKNRYRNVVSKEFFEIFDNCDIKKLYNEMYMGGN